MRRLIAAAIMLAAILVSVTATEATRRGSEPSAGYSRCMADSIIYASATADSVCDSVRVPFDWKIAQIDVWNIGTAEVVEELRLGFVWDDIDPAADTCVVIADLTLQIASTIMVQAGVGQSPSSHFKYEFPVACEKVYLTGGAVGGHWAWCAYCIRYTDAGCDSVTTWP